MGTYLVAPPVPEERMAFMDAVQESGMFIDRNTEGFEVTVGPGQEAVWEEIKQRFDLQVGRDEPPIMVI